MIKKWAVAARGIAAASPARFRGVLAHSAYAAVVRAEIGIGAVDRRVAAGSATGPGIVAGIYRAGIRVSAPRIAVTRRHTVEVTGAGAGRGIGPIARSVIARFARIHRAITADRLTYAAEGTGADQARAAWEETSEAACFS